MASDGYRPRHHGFRMGTLRGLEVQFLGALCVFTGVGLSVVWIFLEGPPLALFGTLVPSQASGAVWTLAAGLLMTIGYGFTFRHDWVWDMTLTTLGFLAAGIGMNAVTWGMTMAVLGSLFGMAMLAVYLLWRRKPFVPIRSARPPQGLRRGRRE